ncbi:cobalamin biosynthesis protein CobG [Ruegeria sp. WL0004]|uniref:Cobalamin biosynthesis protein CobG n=1 Tax=Ruegeria marisflavi TaxID=2984152 RepID=A0ABT2WT10_9RHOB|nr:cobalamin biosynthesis protein CobG [Ruegeria sp. WL0004]MCU9839034.1 cobalamin biosynthesis protein CobG [Ruegeria sp. WL0004]
MTAPIVQGWCPGAHRPMMSGDGLVVRVRPRLARLRVSQALGLCALAERFGNGTIDLTNRANLQLRGVTEADHQPLLAELAALDLLDSEPGIEVRRNILFSPLYREGDMTDRLGCELTARLGELPALPAKFGFAIDTGAGRLLSRDSADIRLERSADGLILRADGMATGREVTEGEAIDRLIELARWFADRFTADTRRMARLVRAVPLPTNWQGTEPGPVGAPLVPGDTALGPLYGAAFGQLPAQALASLLRDSGATRLRVTPWRLILLEGAQAIPAREFVSCAGDPLLTTDACPGAPYCPQAQAETRDLARVLAGRVSGSLHVSGCAKGCARMGAADITLVGNGGRFDLVKQGRAGDEPCQRGLTPETLKTMDLT